MKILIALIILVGLIVSYQMSVVNGKLDQIQQQENHK